MLLCIRSLRAQITINPPQVSHKALKSNLIAIQNTEIALKDKSLFNSITQALLELEHSEFSERAGDALSTSLLEHYRQIIREGRSSEPIGLTLRNAFLVVVKLRTGKIDVKKIDKVGLASALQSVQEMSDVLSDPFGLGVLECPLNLVNDMKNAARLSLLVFRTANPETFLDTKEIRFLIRISAIAEDWGWQQASKAMLVVVAVACGKLELVKEPLATK